MCKGRANLYTAELFRSSDIHSGSTLAEEDRVFTHFQQGDAWLRKAWNK